MGVDAVDHFISRWCRAEGFERGSYVMFLTELCDLLGVPRPRPVRKEEGAMDYVFERPVVYRSPEGLRTRGRIDLYRRGSFVLEAKQGRERGDDGQEPALAQNLAGSYRGSVAWSVAMTDARRQAERYAKALPPEDGWPPFLIVVDIGHVIELWADFTRTGKQYQPYPNLAEQQITMPQLADPKIRAMLRQIWLDPLSLAPAADPRAPAVRGENLALLSPSPNPLGMSLYVDPGGQGTYLMIPVASFNALPAPKLSRGSAAKRVRTEPERGSRLKRAGQGAEGRNR